jgi:hypothetical protein
LKMRQAGSPMLAIGLRINPYEHRCQSGVKSGRCVRLRLQHLTEEQSSVEDQPTITLLVFCLCRDFADGEPFVLQGPAYRLSPGADTHLRIEVGQVPLDRTL